MLHRKKETKGNTELNLQSPPRRSQQQSQDSPEGSAEFNLPMSPRRSPRQSQETRGSTEFNLVSPQRSQKNMKSPRLSFSSPRTKNEHAHPPLPPPLSGGERRSSFKAAMKTLVSPVKKASDMLRSGSFRNLNSPRIISEEEEDEDDEAEEFKKENNDLTLILLCRELELLSD
jgi:hypothetical protein